MRSIRIIKRFGGKVLFIFLLIFFFYIFVISIISLDGMNSLFIFLKDTFIDLNKNFEKKFEVI